jgi:hypothetical protein
MIYEYAIFNGPGRLLEYGRNYFLTDIMDLYWIHEDKDLHEQLGVDPAWPVDLLVSKGDETEITTGF